MINAEQERKIVLDELHKAQRHLCFKKLFEKRFRYDLTPENIRRNSLNLCVDFLEYFEVWYHSDIFCWTDGYKLIIKNCQAWYNLWHSDYITWQLTKDVIPTPAWTLPSGRAWIWQCSDDLEYEFMARFK
jgi:hypothetical protein